MESSTTHRSGNWQSAVEENYAEILQPVFSSQGQTSWFQLACALLRVSGVTLGAWDALQESRAVLADITNLSCMDLSTNLFPDPDATRWRLMLQGYVHVTEMDAPYHILANLLRVQNGLPYAHDPFGDLWTYPKNAKNGERGRPPSPSLKIKRIKELSAARFPRVGCAFDDFYFSALRNAIAHSDYVLDSAHLKMLHGRIPSASGGTLFIPYERLGEIIDTAGGFYRTFFRFERHMRSEFARFSDEPIPFGNGRIEFLVNEEGLMCGFRVKWPSGGICEYREGPTGRAPMNIRITERGVEFIDPVAH